RTRHIMLGSGVTSLPYHHPLLVAQRFVQLDHMTRGRSMLGCGPGALVSDAYMLGIEPVTQRPRMDEALDAIMQLLRCEEPVTMRKRCDRSSAPSATRPSPISRRRSVGRRDARTIP